MYGAKKHFIILGAGASYNFIEEEYLSAEKKAEWLVGLRPPLASELFNPARFGAILNEHEDVKGLVSSVLSELRRGKDLEEYMQELREGGGHRKSQLVALIFYLGKLFQKISDRFGGHPGNNYNALIQAIRDNGGKACVVTFNYDSLLEADLPSQLPKGKHTLADYIKHDLQVIKMHGSCEWSHVSGPYTEYAKKEFASLGGFEKFLSAHPDMVFGINPDPKKDMMKPEVIPSRDFKKNTLSDFRESSTYFSYPALAIPAQTKHSHICPDSHIEELKKSLADAKKVLVVGWKAADKNLLDIFQEVIKYPVEFTLVQGKNSKTLEATKKRILEKVPSAQFKEFNGGFTDFMASPARDAFFQE